MAMQPLLQLRLATTTALVTVETARAALGLDTESVVAMVESGQLQWAWDLSAGNRRLRELRLWGEEIISPLPAPAPVAETEADAYARILPPGRPYWRAAEIAQRLMLSDQTLMRLLPSLRAEVRGHTRWIEGESVRRLLRERRV